jgi:(1->4)-alpha-D-glucan 1-alpha-D-glucosylmutase
LTELAAEWDRRLFKWRRLNKHAKLEVAGVTVPAPGEEVLIYQTMLGAWPLDAAEVSSFLERLRAFAIKAVREAKTHSGWIRHDEPYENALVHFVEVITDSSGENPFLADFLRFEERIAWHGALNSLSQVLLKITSPGIPDHYQGTELWAFTLVDPDNRRPVDFASRVEFLEAVSSRRTENTFSLIDDVVENWRDGRIKLLLTGAALDFRRAHAALFLDGDYLPLTAAGSREAHLCAFAREKDGNWAVTVAPRWTSRLAGTGRLPVGKRIWEDTRLLLPGVAPGKWRNVLTGELVETVCKGGEKALPIPHVFRRFPVALLENI